MKKKEILNSIKKQDFIYCSIILMIVAIIMIIITRGKYIYGSTMDWNSQHFSIPEYFRERFYATGQFFPSFEFNLGAGQNIYNFSYYGLFSPIIWFSYLLPFVKMRTYIVCSSIILIMASDILFYVWMKNKYSSRKCFILTFLFATATPLIYHSHRHIMFVNYMPFLILALMGVDRYFKKRKRILLIVSTFLIIMTSYFFSVGSVCVLVIYGVYVYLENTQSFKIKTFVKEMFLYAYNFVVAVFMSGVLILPTMYTLIQGRGKSNVKIDLKMLFMPNFNGQFVLYGISSMGLTAIFILAVFYMVYTRKKHEMFLGIVFIVIQFIPFVVYVLNGTMYLEAKTLIPFIPLGVLVIARFFDGIFFEKHNIKFLIGFETLIGIICIILMKNKETCGLIFIVDMFIVIVTMVLYYFFRKEKIIVVPAILSALISCVVINCSDNLMLRKDFHDDIDSQIEEAIDYVLSINNSSLYRTYIDIDNDNNLNKVFNTNTFTATMYSSICDKSYKNFYFNEFGIENRYRNSAIMSWGKNVIFNVFIGNRYIIAKNCDVVGYEEVKRISKDVAVYENKDVLPIGYAVSDDKVMEEKEYTNLEYPYNVEALLKYVIVNKDTDDNTVNYENKRDFDIQEYNQKYNIECSDDKLSIEKLTDNCTRITVQADENITYNNINEINSDAKLRLNKNLSDELFIIKFNVDNTIKKNVYKGSKGDTFVNINGVRNKLTNPSWKYYNDNTEFKYVISSKTIDKDMDIKFSYGVYDISNFSMYTYKYNKLSCVKNNVDEFFIKKTSGDNIEGNINVTKEGYFKLTIPYDEGFCIKVDGQRVNYEKVDKTFIGFKIDEGKHDISINYKSPLLKEGKILSLIGIVLMLVCVIFQKKRFYKK